MLEEIVSLCKRRGFIFAGSEVYGGLAGTWDFGPLGAALKDNIVTEWKRFFIEQRDDMYQVDASIIMNPKTWIASGHVDTFADPMVDCRKCKALFRADNLTENYHDLNGQKIKCPTCDEIDWGEVRMFNMMFKTTIGPVSGEKNVTYLRPETAQGVFTNYKNIVDTIYPDLPFGIAQVGKAFRNEISPRDFVFRSREFSQMEIEYFVTPEAWEELFEQWLKDCHQFLTERMGLNPKNLHDLEVSESDRAHYSKRTIDIEFDFPIGREELLGLAYRTDYDLQNVQRESGKSMEYIMKDGERRLIPHVIEPSFGLERLMMAVLTTAYHKETLKDGETRVNLKLPEHLAPYKMAVAPLLKNKPELMDKAREVYVQMKKKYGAVFWDDSGNIGKRYRKADEIGVPKYIVVDFETLEDDTVTVRDRDSMEQERKKISDL